ncbi:MAG: insulinase family protein [Gottschalkiaceae bacterium]|nr:MAG: insulinase family protein [Gottschalkiaceae bacterium]
MSMIINKSLNEKILSAELSNGLRVFCMPKTNYVRKHAIYATNYGSNDNKFIPIGESKEIIVPEGIAHFLEHKLFEEPDVDIFEEFGKLGSYVNAFTNNNQTAYLFSCIDKFYENLELLVSFVQNPYFTDENVEKEKGIIQQEIKMYNDAPDWKVYSNCLSGLYNSHPVKIDIAGTIESIQNINVDLLYKCYNTFYNPENMVLFMIGDIDFKKALSIVEERGIKYEKLKENIVRGTNNEPSTIPKKIIEEKQGIHRPLFNIGFKDLELGFDGDSLAYKEHCTNILLEVIFGSSSDFYHELYNEGLINDKFGFQYVGYRDYGYAILGGESDAPKEVYNRILSFVELKKKNGLLERDFNRAKKKLMGYHLIDSNSIDFIARNFINDYYNKYTLLNYLETLEKIKIEDVEHRIKDFLNENQSALSIVTPK